ncbi:MAG: hypothetical protein KIH01_01615 [Candidatus Freyarchaeota archaeon]|nr:hypothetical protein [Candidatus Jordarchaeia archaeon]
MIPIIPKSSEFKRNLRDSLLRNWVFCAHYVDSAIKQAYSILKLEEELLEGKKSESEACR